MFTLEDYEKIVAEVPEEMDVALLINNAGTGWPGPFEELYPEKELQFEITVNTLHPYYSTKAWIDRFKKRKERSAIINVASTMGAVEMVFNSTYCTTKNFLSFFSRSLDLEFKHGKAGIDILDYRPAFVSTNLSKREPGVFVVTTK